MPKYTSLTRIISDEEILRFCQLTSDPNKIHDSDYLEGRRLVVPGFLTVSIAAGIASERIGGGATIEFYLSKAAFAGDRLEFRVGMGFPARMSSLRGEDDILTSEVGNVVYQSGIHKNPSEYPRQFGCVRHYGTAPLDFRLFSEITGASESSALYLFPAALSLKALWDSVKLPTTINDMSAAEVLLKKGFSPVIVKGSVTLINGFNPAGNHEIGITSDSSPERDGIKFTVWGNQDLTPLYTMQLFIRPLPEKVINRMVERASKTFK